MTSRRSFRRSANALDERAPDPATGPSSARKLVGRGANLRMASVATMLLNFGASGLRMGIQAGLARWLGPVGYGRFVLLRGWGGLLGRLPDRGFNLALIRWLPRYEEQELGGSTRRLIRHVVIRTARNSVIVAAAAMAFSAFVLHDSRTSTLVGLLLVVTGSLVTTLRHALQGTYRHVLGVSLTEVVQPATFAVLAVIFGVLIGRSVTATLAALAIAGAVVAGLEALAIRARLPADDAVSADSENDWGEGTLPLYIGQLGIASQEVSYLLIVGATLGPTEAALFAVAQRLSVLARMGNSAVESLIGPEVARLGRAGKESSTELQSVIDRGIRLSLLFTGTVCVGLIVASDFALRVFGDEFVDATGMLRVLLIGMIFNALTGPTGYLVSMTGSQTIFGYVMLGHAIVGASAAWTAATVLDTGVAVAAVTALTTVSWNLWFVIVGIRRLGVWSMPGGAWLAKRFGDP